MFWDNNLEKLFTFDITCEIHTNEIESSRIGFWKRIGYMENLNTK